jgi:YggT family protein
VNAFLSILAQGVWLLRQVAFGVVVVGAALCAVSWATRTRRLNPFGGLGRLARTRVDPLLAPVDRAVRRAGGTDAAVPWWGLAALVVACIMGIQLLEYVAGLAAQIVGITQARSLRGAVALVTSLALSALELAIIVRVLASWIPAIEGARWLRWTYALSEPILAPLRRVLPTFGPIDISPLVALLLIQVLGRWMVGALLA